MGTRTETNVPGRKMSVKTVMPCMETVSCSVSAAISCIRSVHSCIVLAEVSADWA